MLAVMSVLSVYRCISARACRPAGIQQWYRYSASGRQPDNAGGVLTKIGIFFYCQCGGLGGLGLSSKGKEKKNFFPKPIPATHLGLICTRLAGID